MRFEKKLDDPVRNIMTRKGDLVTVGEDYEQNESIFSGARQDEIRAVLTDLAARIDALAAS